MRRLIKFAMTSLYPRSEDLPGLADTDLDGYLNTFFREAPFVHRAAIVAGTAAIVAGPILTLRRPLLATSLDPEALATHLERLAYHRLYIVRQLTFLMKMVAGMAWGASDPVRASFDLPPLEDDPKTWRSDGVPAAQDQPI
ncbi:MAG: hypothetical protein ACI9MR_004756 [Myxococcota bacterium]|jgi:hypothetical protein